MTKIYKILKNECPVKYGMFQSTKIAYFTGKIEKNKII